MRPNLRIFNGEDSSCSTLEEPKVNVKLGEIVHILTDASLSRRTWLNDFEDDEVLVSADLYEILNAYWQFRPGA